VGSPVFRQLLCFFFFAGLLFPFTGLCADSLNLPFSPGEEIFYDIRWQRIKAGSCSIKVLPFTQVDRFPVFHFQMTIQSNSVVDKIHKIRDVLEGFVSKDFSGSLLYTHTARGKEKKARRVEFFREKNEVIYSESGHRNDPLEIPENTFDPVGSFYQMRTLDLGVGKTLMFPVTDGKKTFFQRGEVVKKETISTPLGLVDAVVLVPSSTHFSGVFEKSKNPKVWVWISADEKKIPLRIEVKVMVGSIIFDLASFRPGASGTASP
jgi:hypothetical protein